MQDVISSESFYGCECFYTKNYYLAEWNIHVEYENENDFLSQYRKVLSDRGCIGTEQIKVVLNQLNAEQKRRKSIASHSIAKKCAIQRSYVPLHEEVFTLKDSYLNKEFIQVVEYAKQEDANYFTMVDMLQKEHAEEVFRLQVFTAEFCKMFIQELKHFEDSEFPKTRPNTMNNSGILLGELGLDENFLTPLRMKYLNPLSRILFPEWGGGLLDSHRGFTVKYNEDRDVGLGYHYDNAEVTLNVSLDEDFDDGSLYFGSMRQVLKHCVGEGILHRGQHMHGAMPISYGERTNLIIWMRASSIRNKLCPMCDRKPVLVAMPGFGDGFTMKSPLAQQTVQVCTLY